MNAVEAAPSAEDTRAGCEHDEARASARDEGRADGAAAPQWVRMQCPRGVYYENTLTGATQWLAPPGVLQEVERERDAMGGNASDRLAESRQALLTRRGGRGESKGAAFKWVEMYDSLTDTPYYENVVTNATTWNAPSSYAPIAYVLAGTRAEHDVDGRADGGARASVIASANATANAARAPIRAPRTAQLPPFAEQRFVFKHLGQLREARLAAERLALRRFEAQRPMFKRLGRMRKVRDARRAEARAAALFSPVCSPARSPAGSAVRVHYYEYTT